MRRIAASLFAAVVAFLLSPHAARGDEMVLVKDINANARPLAVYARCQLGSKEILFADDGLRGLEPWVGDGLAGTTTLLKDINPGVTESVHSEDCVVVGNVLLFAADDGVHGLELWKTDGTAAGTVMVKDIRPGSEWSIPGYFASVAGGTLAIFSANDGTNGRELWRSDGTEAGTALVMDINPGGADASPAGVINLNANTVVFQAGTAAEGTELWKSDGTSGGTMLVKNIEAGAASSNPSHFAALGNSKVFFSASTSGAGTEPWVSDGTASGLIADITPGASGTSLSNFVSASKGGAVLFQACEATFGCEIWLSTGFGTTIFKDINPTGSSGPDGITVIDGVAYFLARDGTSGYNGRFFRSDGTEAGTTAFASQGLTYFSISSLPVPFIKGPGDTVYFGGWSSTYGYELFKLATDQCPADAAKTTPGYCGCGVADADANGNGIIDCLDAVATVTPPRPSLRVKGSKVSIKMKARSHVTYRVFYGVQKTGTKLGKKAAFKSKIVATNTTTLKKPKKGYTLYVKYRYLASGAPINSKTSKVASKAIIK